MRGALQGAGVLPVAAGRPGPAHGSLGALGASARTGTLGRMPAWRLLALLLVAILGLSASAQADGTGARTRLVVGVFDAPPFSEPLRRDDGTVVWAGTSIRLFESIADELGLEIEYRAGSEEAVVAALADGSIDACASPLAPTSSRIRRFDFSHPFATVGLAGALRAEDTMLDELTLLARGLVKASQRRIYLILLLAILAAAVLLWFLERSRNADFGSRRIHGFGAALWWAVVTLTTVGYGDKVPRTPSGRFVAGVWMLVSLVLTSVFTATIVSSLTVGSLETLRVESPADLARLRVRTVRSSAAADWLDGLGLDFDAVATLDEALDGLEGGECDTVIAPAIELRAEVRGRSGVVVGGGRFAEQYACFGLSRGLGDDLARRIDESLVARSAPAGDSAGLEPVAVEPLPAADGRQGEGTRNEEKR